MKIKSKKIIKYKEKIPVYDLSMNPDNPCFSLPHGIVSHNTIPPGGELMELFIPRSERLIYVHFDASQAEVRVIAVLAGEQALIDAFEQGLDIHRFIASNIFKKEMDDITSTERQYAKQAVFSILYGRTIESFAIEFLKGDVAAAKKIFSGMFDRFPKVAAWIAKSQKDLLDTGSVYTLFEDAIPIPFDKDKKWAVSRALRQAQNMPVQSSSSSIIAVSIWELYVDINKFKIEAIPNGFTHDSSDWEVFVKQLIQFIRLTNKNIVYDVKRKFGIPMKIDFEIGINKGNMIGISNTQVTHKGKGITFDFESKETGFKENIIRLRTYFIVKYVITKTEKVAEGLEDLFFPKKAYSTYLGVEREKYQGKMSLILK